MLVTSTLFLISFTTTTDWTAACSLLLRDADYVIWLLLLEDSAIKQYAHSKLKTSSTFKTDTQIFERIWDSSF